MEIKAIPTIYKGYKFRSRLEARWAVFFDAMGIEWEYEREGFVLDRLAEKDDGDGVIYGGNIFYLPDFYLPKEDLWVEVKPYQFTELEGETLQRFARHFSIVAAIGLPDTKEYTLLEWLDSESDISKAVMQHGLFEYALDAAGVTMADLPGFVAYAYRFGESRFFRYLESVLKRAKGHLESEVFDWKRFVSQENHKTWERKWKQALARSCNIAKQARFEYGEGG